MAVIEAPAENASPPADAVNSFRQILGSTVLIGGSSAVNVVLGLVRNKAFAILLGPEGVGLLGLFTAILDLAQTAAGGGIQGSGVRQVAECAGKGDEARLRRTAAALQFLSLVLGAAGAAALLLFAVPIAAFTFEDHTHATAVALLAAAVFFRVISTAQSAIIQGLRRIGDLARLNILSAVYGTLFSIPLVYLLGVDGIVPAIIVVAAATTITSWWYVRKTALGARTVPLVATRPEMAALLRLGLVFAASALLMTGSAYAVRVIIIRDLGAEPAGFYHAAWAFASLYAGFILQAMSADFYPRLTAAADDNAKCNRLVNEQAQVSILLAGPGLLAALTLAPWLILVVYTAEFQPAVDLLRWICLGMLFRIISWPMSFIVLAKNAQRIFLITEIAAACVHVGLTFLLIDLVGLTGAGLGFVGLYVFHGLMIYGLVGRLSGFRWSGVNIRLGLIFLVAAGVVLAGFRVLPPAAGFGLGAAATLATGLYSLNVLVRLFPGRLAALQAWARSRRAVR